MQFKIVDRKVSVGFSQVFHDQLKTSAQKILSLRKQSKELIAQDSSSEMKIRNEFYSRVDKESIDAFEDPTVGLYIPAGRNITVSFSEQFQMLFFGQLREKQQQLLEEKAQLEADKNYYENELKYIDSDEYIIKEAKERLGWLFDDETKYVIEDDSKKEP